MACRSGFSRPEPRPLAQAGLPRCAISLVISTNGRKFFSRMRATKRQTSRWRAQPCPQLQHQDARPVVIANANEEVRNWQRGGARITWLLDADREDSDGADCKERFAEHRTMLIANDPGVFQWPGLVVEQLINLCDFSRLGQRPSLGNDLQVRVHRGFKPQGVGPWGRGHRWCRRSCTLWIGISDCTLCSAMRNFSRSSRSCASGFLVVASAARGFSSGLYASSIAVAQSCTARSCMHNEYRTRLLGVLFMAGIGRRQSKAHLHILQLDPT